MSEEIVVYKNNRTGIRILMKSEHALFDPPACVSIFNGDALLTEIKTKVEFENGLRFKRFPVVKLEEIEHSAKGNIRVDLEPESATSGRCYAGMGIYEGENLLAVIIGKIVPEEGADGDMYPIVKLNKGWLSNTRQNASPH